MPACQRASERASERASVLPVPAGILEGPRRQLTRVGLQRRSARRLCPLHDSRSYHSWQAFSSKPCDRSRSRATLRSHCTRGGGERLRRSRVGERLAVTVEVLLVQMVGPLRVVSYADAAAAAVVAKFLARDISGEWSVETGVHQTPSCTVLYLCMLVCMSMCVGSSLGCVCVCATRQLTEL